MRRKSSKQRDRIMDFLQQADGHLTAEEIYKNLQAQGEQISLATVYRNLGVLEELNKICRVAHPHDGYCYDKTTVPQHHLHCIRCNRLIDIDLPYDASLNARIAEQTGAEVVSHSITAEGICEHCRKMVK